MEPSNNTGQNFETAPVQPVAPETQGAAPVEQAPAAPTPETMSQSGDAASQGPAMVLPPPVLKPIPVPQPAAPQPTSDPSTVQGTPIAADDVDVIEKEWVDKAKEIVDKTSGDPHRQNKEVSVLKADYMKKRYNKDIKLEDNS